MDRNTILIIVLVGAATYFVLFGNKNVLAANNTLQPYTGLPGTQRLGLNGGIPYETGGPSAGSIQASNAGAGLGTFFSALGKAFGLGTAVAAQGNSPSSPGVASAAGDSATYSSGLYDPINTTQDLNASISTQQNLGDVVAAGAANPPLDIASPSLDGSVIPGGYGVGTSLDFPQGTDVTPIPTYTLSFDASSVPPATDSLGIPTSADTGGILD